MNLRTKKILAREFLLIIICIVISSFGFLGVMAYNGFQNRLLKKLLVEKLFFLNKIQNLESTYTLKIRNQKRFYDESVKNNWHTRDWDYLNLWNKLQTLKKSDSINYQWKNLYGEEFQEIVKNQFGIQNGKDFENFIGNNSLTKKDNRSQIEIITINSTLKKINDQIKIRQKKVFQKNEKMEFAFMCLFILGTILFPVRYLLYGIIWSLKTLKNIE